MNRLKASMFIIVLVIIGCASIETGNKVSLYDETARAYDTAFRWGNYEQAYGFKKMTNTDPKLPDFDAYRQIRVTDYVVKNTIVSADKSKILRLVSIQYYRMRDVTVKVITDRQVWEYDENEDRWYLMSDLPELK